MRTTALPSNLPTLALKSSAFRFDETWQAMPVSPPGPPLSLNKGSKKSRLAQASTQDNMQLAWFGSQGGLSKAGKSIHSRSFNATIIPTELNLRRCPVSLLELAAGRRGTAGPGAVAGIRCREHGHTEPVPREDGPHDKCHKGRQSRLQDPGKNRLRGAGPRMHESGGIDTQVNGQGLSESRSKCEIHGFAMPAARPGGTLLSGAGAPQEACPKHADSCVWQCTLHRHWLRHTLARRTPPPASPSPA